MALITWANTPEYYVYESHFEGTLLHSTSRRSQSIWPQVKSTELNRPTPGSTRDKMLNTFCKHHFYWFEGSPRWHYMMIMHGHVSNIVSIHELWTCKQKHVFWVGLKNVDVFSTIQHIFMSKVCMHIHWDSFCFCWVPVSLCFTSATWSKFC